MAENETYQVVAECTNCGHTPKEIIGEVVQGPLEYKIPKGELASEYLRSQTCPNCGCKGYLKRKFS